MADNFNENQIELISSNKIIYDFDETMGDYVQVIVTNQDGEIVRLNDKCWQFKDLWLIKGLN